MANVPAGYVLIAPGLTGGEYQLVEGRLRRELPHVRFHGEPLGQPPVGPGDPAFALWVHPDDAGSQVEYLVMETVSR